MVPQYASKADILMMMENPLFFPVFETEIGMVLAAFLSKSIPNRRVDNI